MRMHRKGVKNATCGRISRFPLCLIPASSAPLRITSSLRFFKRRGSEDVAGLEDYDLRRCDLRWLSKSRSRCRRRRSNRSESRSRRLRLKIFVAPKRRLGPRPSQRPSLASWQLTNFEHFLSHCEALRPRPWAIVSVDTAKIINRLKTTIPKTLVEVEGFIKFLLEIFTGQ
jgi:hypothetical protein